MATTMTKISRRRLAVLDPAGFWRRKAVGSRASSARHHRARVCRNGDEEPTPQSLDDSLMALHLRLVLDRSTALAPSSDARPGMLRLTRAGEAWLADYERYRRATRALEKLGIDCEIEIAKRMSVKDFTDECYSNP